MAQGFMAKIKYIEATNQEGKGRRIAGGEVLGLKAKEKVFGLRKWASGFVLDRFC